MKMFKIFLYNLLFFILLISIVLGNREDTNVTNDGDIPDIEENNNVSEKNSTEEAWKFIEEGEYESSKDILKELINKNNENPEAWNLLGYIERQIQNFNKSLKYYNKALLLNPDYIPAHHYIAITYLEIGNLERAKHHLDKLDLLCLFGCEEFYNLEDAIAMYEKNNG